MILIKRKISLAPNFIYFSYPVIDIFLKYTSAKTSNVGCQLPHSAMFAGLVEFYIGILQSVIYFILTINIASVSDINHHINIFSILITP